MVRPEGALQLLAVYAVCIGLVELRRVLHGLYAVYAGTSPWWPWFVLLLLVVAVAKIAFGIKLWWSRDRLAFRVLFGIAAVVTALILAWMLADPGRFVTSRARFPLAVYVAALALAARARPAIVSSARDPRPDGRSGS